MGKNKSKLIGFLIILYFIGFAFAISLWGIIYLDLTNRIDIEKKSENKINYEVKIHEEFINNANSLIFKEEMEKELCSMINIENCRIRNFEKEEMKEGDILRYIIGDENTQISLKVSEVIKGKDIFPSSYNILDKSMLYYAKKSNHGTEGFFYFNYNDYIVDNDGYIVLIDGFTENKINGEWSDRKSFNTFRLSWNIYNPDREFLILDHNIVFRDTLYIPKTKDLKFIEIKTPD